MDFCHIVPARVYSLKDPSNKKLVYVDADGESSTCWVATWFAEKQGWIGPETNTEEMFLSTIFADNADVKTTPEVFLAVDDLVVESMDGQMTALLPTCYATGRIPVSHRSIPTKEAVRQFSHLSQVANELPEVREDVPIVGQKLS